MELSARQIRSAVLALRKSDGPEISGVRVRAFLKRRHGHPGSVSRVYRVLRETLSEYERRQLPATVPPDTVALLAECERLRASEAAAVLRASLAEHREQVHQDKWLQEIDQLRQQIKELEPLKRRPGALAEERLQLYRELHLARARIAELEDQQRRADKLESR